MKIVKTYLSDLDVKVGDVFATNFDILTNLPPHTPHPMSEYSSCVFRVPVKIMVTRITYDYVHYEYIEGGEDAGNKYYGTFKEHIRGGYLMKCK